MFSAPPPWIVSVMFFIAFFSPFRVDGFSSFVDIIQQKTAKSQYGLRFFGNGLAGYAIMALSRDHETRRI